MKTIGTYTCLALATLLLSEHSAVGMNRAKELLAQANQDLIAAAYKGNTAAAQNALARGAQPNCFGRVSTDTQNPQPAQPQPIQNPQGLVSPADIPKLSGITQTVIFLKTLLPTSLPSSNQLNTELNNKSGRTNILYTPLYLAAKKGHFQVAQMLISAGAQVNLGANNQSTTPLHAAAQTDKRDTQSLSKNQCDMMKLLIQHGASLYEHDALGKTPLEYVHGVTADDMSSKQSIIDNYKSRQRRIYGAEIGCVICLGLLYSCSRLLYTWYTSPTDEFQNKHTTEQPDQNNIANGDTHDT